MSGRGRTMIGSAKGSFRKCIAQDSENTRYIVADICSTQTLLHSHTYPYYTNQTDASQGGGSGSIPDLS